MSGLVGPILRMSDLIPAIVAAIEDDNPDKEIEVTDRGAYVRVAGDPPLRLTRRSLERRLGREFEMRELEHLLSAFAGRIDNKTDEIVFYQTGRDAHPAGTRR
jgi:toluene monooxygenase system protein D